MLHNSHEVAELLATKCGVGRLTTVESVGHLSTDLKNHLGLIPTVFMALFL